MNGHRLPMQHGPDPASWPKRGYGRSVCAVILACLLAAVMTACVGDRTATVVSPGSAAQPGPAATTSQFQQWLNEYQVPFAVPQRGRGILVNIPAFELIAFEDGEPVLRSRIIVGSANNPTPVLETHTTAVRFRPTWRPTPDMVRTGEYRDRIWPPGLGNPLGLLAIRLEPGLLVYLHDTNQRQLFDEPERALSHGCIRVERWDALAAWVLDLDLGTIHAWANGRRTFDMRTPYLPVFLGYYTAFPDDAGELKHFVDVYGLEANESDSPE